ncbi:MAG: FAD:protein FMN transferase [Selenomonadaceae bacterium]|nr:FAD:protein FMN transferase [Selenomonadaceae bacterium]
MIILMLSAAACSRTPYTKTAVVMDTVVELQADDGEQEKAVDEAMAYLKKLDALASQNDGSDLEALRAAAGTGEWVQVSPEVYDMLAFARAWSEKTDGAFDVTAGPVIWLWGIGTPQERVPSDAEIAEARSHVGWRKLELRESDHSARLMEQGMRVHLGAIAKGYALDGVREIYEKHGVKNGLVSLGGSSIDTYGMNLKNQKWRIGIRHPRADDPKMYLGVAPLSDAALSSSGDYERYFEQDGQRYHHIFDPATGRPAASGLMGVTVIARGEHAGELSDILTTALFVLGEQRGRELIEQSGIDATALFVRQDGTFLRLATATSGDLPDARDILEDVDESVAWE